MCTIHLDAKTLDDSLKRTAEEYRTKAYSLQVAGDLKGALAFYQKSVNIYPNFPEAFNDLGVILEHFGDFHAARKMYEKSISLDPNFLPPYTNLALLYEQRGDMDQAVYFWKLRYSMSTQHDFWWYKSLEHLSRLTNESKYKDLWLTHQTETLGKLVVARKAQQKKYERQQTLQNAQQLYQEGLDFFKKGEFKNSMDSFYSALLLSPPDQQLHMDISQHYIDSKYAYARERVQTNVREALVHLDKNEFEQTAQRLKSALSVIFSIQD